MRVTVIAAILLSLNAQQHSGPPPTASTLLKQAERGRRRYASTCQGCHAADLSGGVGSALKGDRFRSDWGGLPLARLLERIRTMPPGAPAPQPEDAAVELLAHILAGNGFPAGKSTRLNGLTIFVFSPASDPTPCRISHSCRSSAASSSRTPGEWLITSATAPVRTTNPETLSRGRTTAPRSPASATPRSAS